MAERLVWNFEFIANSSFNLKSLKKEPKDDLKWEARYFWDNTSIILLNLVDLGLLALANYQHKLKNDTYYLLKDNYNIKSRLQELSYKPLVCKAKYSFAYAPKINFSPQKNPANLPATLFYELNSSKTVLVEKESFIYKFATSPVVKLELARLNFNNKLYFSLCVEGKSQVLVESITRGLLGEKKLPEEYISFLKDKKCKT